MQKNGDYLIGEIKDICKKQPGNHFKSEIRDSSRVAPNVDDILKNKTKPTGLSPQYRRFFPPMYRHPGSRVSQMSQMNQNICHWTQLSQFTE